jgi:small subunit ribosomal protein S2
MREMNQIPAALFVIDIGKEDICIAEAQRMGVKIFAIVDTDCDPAKVSHPMPGNDDAVRSIRLITGRMATAVLEGLALREAQLEAEREELALAEAVEAEELALSEREELALTEQVGQEGLDRLEDELLSAGQYEAAEFAQETPQVAAGAPDQPAPEVLEEPAASDRAVAALETVQEVVERQVDAPTGPVSEAGALPAIDQDIETDDPMPGPTQADNE